MPSTHTALHYHLTFSTKNRTPWIEAPWRDRLHEYLGGTIGAMGGIALCVGGVDDHVHLLVPLRPVHLLSDVLRDLKKSSSRWIHKTLGNRRFAWQVGYGAFTVSGSNVAEVKRYIERQEAHHRKRTFREEYVQLLRHHGVDFDERHLW